MRIFITIALYFLTLSDGFGQSDETLSGKNIFLFGESHFVGEKYDLMHESISTIIDSTENSDTVQLVLELPSSFEYVLYRLKKYNDTTFFNNYYQNLYAEKKPASLYWVDYKRFINAYIDNCEAKHIEWSIRCVDIEKTLRSTAYVLDKICGPLDSLLSQKYIYKDSLTRQYLIEKIEDALTNKKLTETETYYLNRIHDATGIPCTSCQWRDSLMYANFKRIADATNNLIIGNFGYGHVLDNATDLLSPRNPKATRGKEMQKEIQPFYAFFSEDLKSRTYKISLLAFKIVKPNSYFVLDQNYEELMTESERTYLKEILGSSNKVTIELKDHADDLPNLSKQFDYLILLKESTVTW
tara:strand:- start:1040 stop:2104 length:1065 start_codon:yes stop_codon:yes gene_type:complete